MLGCPTFLAEYDIVSDVVERCRAIWLIVRMPARRGGVNLYMHGRTRAERSLDSVVDWQADLPLITGRSPKNGVCRFEGVTRRRGSDNIGTG